MTNLHSNNQTILAIDSSLSACSVAIWKNQAVSAYYEELGSASQAKKLLPMVEKALSSSTISYSELTSVACCVGPGSFTGIRIGLASARAIGFAAKIPVLGFNSLMVIAMDSVGKESGNSIIATINAGKGEVVTQTFDKNLVALGEPTLFAQSLAPVPTSAINFPRADLLARLAANYSQFSVKPLPFYVRPPDAKLPQEKTSNY